MFDDNLLTFEHERTLRTSWRKPQKLEVWMAKRVSRYVASMLNTSMPPV